VTGGGPGGGPVWPGQPPDRLDVTAVERELAEVRERLHLLQATARPALGYRHLLGGYGAALAALLLAVLAVVSILGGIEDRDPAGAVAAAILGAAALAAVALAVRLFRRAFRAIPEIAVERAALLARQGQLTRILAGQGTDPSGRPIPVVGPTVPLDRQPGAWAQAMHGKFRLGPSPAEVLRRLPPDTPRWKVWLARNVGWGAAAAVLIVLGMVLVGTLLAVALTAGHP
jgi:hypothetical protein